MTAADVITPAATGQRRTGTFVGRRKDSTLATTDAMRHSPIVM